MTATASAPTPVNIGTEQELIQKIAMCLMSKNIDRMTSAERNIVKFLAIHNYIELSENGERIKLVGFKG